VLGPPAWHRGRAGRDRRLSDADTTFDAAWLSNIDRAFTRSPSCVAVAGPCRFVGGPRWGLAYTRLVFGLVRLLYRITGKVCYVTATNIAFRKSAWTGYDTRLTQAVMSWTCCAGREHKATSSSRSTTPPSPQPAGYTAAADDEMLPSWPGLRCSGVTLISIARGSGPLRPACRWTAVPPPPVSPRLRAGDGRWPSIRLPRQPCPGSVGSRALRISPSARPTRHRLGGRRRAGTAAASRAVRGPIRATSEGSRTPSDTPSCRPASRGRKSQARLGASAPQNTCRDARPRRALVHSPYLSAQF
jgi:hypothetical protein